MNESCKDSNNDRQSVTLTLYLKFSNTYATYYDEFQ